MKKQKDLTLKRLQQMMWEYTDSRTWEEHYYPDQLAKSVAIEASDLLKEFQWVDDAQINEFITDTTERKRLAFKTIDVLYYLFMFAESLDIDIATYIRLKLQEVEVEIR